MTPLEAGFSFHLLLEQHVLHNSYTVWVKEKKKNLQTSQNFRIYVMNNIIAKMQNVRLDSWCPIMRVINYRVKL